MKKKKHAFKNRCEVNFLLAIDGFVGILLSEGQFSIHRSNYGRGDATGTGLGHVEAERVLAV